MSENTNVSCLPREMLRWMNSLDLAYQVRNIRRDLANGFVVAEMLQRYYPKEVNIFSYYNGLNQLQKVDNWQRLAAVLAKKEMVVTPDTYMQVLHMAPLAALELLLRLYTHLTNKKVDTMWVERAFRPQDHNGPHYLKKTAGVLSKDREITRIVDETVQKRVIEQTIQRHDLQNKQDKAEMHLDEYMHTKRVERKQAAHQKQQAQEVIKAQLTEMQNNPEIIEIPIKTFNNDRNNKKQEVIVEGREITDFLSKVCKQTIDQKPLSKELAELKLEESINKAVYVFNNAIDFSKKSIKEMVIVLNENISQIVEIVNNNYSEYSVFFQMMMNTLQHLQVEFKAYRLLIQLLQNLGTQLMRLDGISTQMFFENICLQRMLDIMTKYQNKRISIIQLINSYCQPDSGSKLRIIKKAKSMFKSDINKFMAFLSYFIENGFELEIDDEFYNLLLFFSMTSLESPSAITRTRGLKLINEIIHVNYKPILNLLDKFGKFTQDTWWECRAQLLILSAQALIYLATDQHDSQMFDQQSEIKEEGEQDSVPVHNDSQLDTHRRENQEYLLSLIYDMFQSHTNENILRIGLIYLAPVTNYYSQLCDRYLEIMMNVNEKIRENVLDITPRDGQEEGQIVNGCNSFKYKLTGVCLNWNCCGIAESLDKFIKGQDSFDGFEKDHLEIVQGCMVNKLADHQASQWLAIYESIKEYLFLSLCESQLCTLGSQILKKFLTFHKITEQVLLSSQDVLLNILSLIYHPDSEEYCQNNLLNLFKYLTEEADFFKEYIYNIVKSFSEGNIAYFLKSNLTVFMNDLSIQRKKKILAQQ